MKLVARTLAELDAGFVLAPERYVVSGGAAQRPEGVRLSELVVERGEPLDRAALGGALVIDTTHAKDGLLDLASAERAARTGSSPKSAKKRALRGDLLVSRLRPYLRQVALVTVDALAVSPEFFVLAPATPGEDLSYLLPYFLSDTTQALLASLQEGGHHPRVPRTSLMALTVPSAVVRGRKRASARVTAALAALARAEGAYRAALGGPAQG